MREIFAWGISAMECGIQVEESGIPLTIGIQNPRSTNKDWNQNLESRIYGAESGIQDCLGFHYMGRGLVTHYEKNLYPASMSLSKVCQSLQGSRYKYLQKYLFSRECTKETFCFHIRIPQSCEAKFHRLFLMFLRVGDRS